MFKAIAYSDENCKGEPMSEDMISINLGACEKAKPTIFDTDYGPFIDDGKALQL